MIPLTHAFPATFMISLQITDIQMISGRWDDSTATYQRLMAHWEAVLPNPILQVPYEALVADQEGWTRKLVDFIGLPWDERCLAFHQNERPVYTYSLWQVRQPIYTNRSSVGAAMKSTWARCSRLWRSPRRRHNSRASKGHASPGILRGAATAPPGLWGGREGLAVRFGVGLRRERQRIDRRAYVGPTTSLRRRAL